MKSSAFATSAASLFLAACGGSTPADSTTPAATPATGAPPPAAAPASEGAAGMPTPGGDQVRCLGINECKGQGACNVAGGHSCAGQNECKGKGWVLVGAADCTARSGTVQP